MAYSNAAIFASEFITTLFAIYMAETVVATELLPKTKGRSMGWGFVSMGYGLAFGFGVMILGYISAIMNPAVALANLILGQINGAQFAAAVGGEFLGAFFGAMLVWLNHLPHFKTSPTDYFTFADTTLLNSGTISQADLEIASYNVQPEDVEARRRGIKDICYGYQDIKHYLKNDFLLHDPVKNAPLAKVTVVPNEIRDQKGHDGNLHGHSSPSSGKSFSSYTSSSAHSTSVDADIQGYRKNADASTTQNQQQPYSALSKQEKREQHLKKLYDSAVIADQNVKLSIFCTRPAIYSPALNFLCEFLCTTALIYEILLIVARQDLLYGPERSLYQAQQGIWIGFFIFLCVLGLGGPTGIAANPARDFAPRVFHWLAPIPGKGGSDFYYSWIPVVAPLLGGCAAAGLYRATQLLNNSLVPADAVFPAPVG